MSSTLVSSSVSACSEARFGKTTPDRNRGHRIFSVPSWLSTNPAPRQCRTYFGMRLRGVALGHLLECDRRREVRHGELHVRTAAPVKTDNVGALCAKGAGCYTNWRRHLRHKAELRTPIGGDMYAICRKHAARMTETPGEPYHRRL